MLCCNRKKSETDGLIASKKGRPGSGPRRERRPPRTHGHEGPRIKYAYTYTRYTLAPAGCRSGASIAQQSGAGARSLGLALAIGKTKNIASSVIGFADFASAFWLRPPTHPPTRLLVIDRRSASAVSTRPLHRSSTLQSTTENQ